MPRIRSVHPGLFTDEAFVSCSAMGRLLLIGLWTEADDQGVFEWKPITIKMRLFPADNIDVEPLLNELVEARWVTEFQDGDRKYGALRNFRRFQKPKSPNAVHPLPTHLRKYVGLEATSSETAKGERDLFPQNGEMTPQMEEGGGKGGGSTTPHTPQGAERANGHARVSKQEVDAAFDRFWAAYPKKVAKPKARDRFERILKRHQATPEALIRGAERYAAEVARRQPAPDGRVPMAHPTTWLNEGRWTDEDAGQPSGAPQHSETWRNLSEEERERYRQLAREKQMEREH